MPLPERPQNITLGIGLMLAGTFIFSVNDVIGKWLAAALPIGQILFVRSVVALAILAPILTRGRSAPIRLPRRPLLQLLRAVLSAAEVTCFYLAVATLPLATTKTYYLATPIYVTLLAALILGERVGWRRWSAVLIGFAGVLITLQPAVGSALGWPALVAFAGSVFHAVLVIVTRTLRETSDTDLIGGQVIACLVLGAVWAPFEWAPMTLRDLVATGLVGIGAMSGWLCVSRALKVADASAVAPYQYTTIVWAVLFGYIFFNDVPHVATAIGAAIIIGAGLFIFVRERRVKPQADTTVFREPTA